MVRLLNLLLCSTIITQFTYILGHEELDTSKDYSRLSRTCPHRSDMDERIASFMGVLDWCSSGENIHHMLHDNSLPSCGDYLRNEVFASNEATISFPMTISASKFSYPDFKAGLVDMSKHAVWYNMDDIQNGPSGKAPDGIENYGVVSTVSFGRFLADLPYSVDIVPGTQAYFCDEETAWGFGPGTVFIKDENINCNGKTYVGYAHIFTTFKNVKNSFGNDEWRMVEAIFSWDIYSEKEMKCGSNGEGSPIPNELPMDTTPINISPWTDSLYFGNSWLWIVIIFVLILLCNIYMLYGVNCVKQKKYGYSSVKRVDSEYYDDSEKNHINA